MFSEAFIFFIVVAGLIWTGLGAAVLVLLLLRDWKNHELW